MTEHEKLLAGLPFENGDPELWQLHQKGWAFNQAYNTLPSEDLAERQTLLEKTLAHIGTGSRVNQPFLVDYGCHISIGNHSLVNIGCTFLDTGRITIGDRVLIGPDVKIYTADHPLFGTERMAQNAEDSVSIVVSAAPVTIGDNSWIGGGAIILPGVTIGSNTVIGAGSVVTKDIPDNAIACGNPATIKKWNVPPDRQN